MIRDSAHLVPGVPRLAFSEEVFIIELMATITIPKKEYQELVDKKFRYEMLREIMKEDIFAPPPTRNREGTEDCTLCGRTRVIRSAALRAADAAADTNAATQAEPQQTENRPWLSYSVRVSAATTRSRPSFLAR